MALSGEAMLLCGRGSTESFTRAFQEHDQAGRDFIIKGTTSSPAGPTMRRSGSSNFMILASS